MLHRHRAWQNTASAQPWSIITELHHNIAPLHHCSITTAIHHNSDLSKQRFSTTTLHHNSSPSQQCFITKALYHNSDSAQQHYHNRAPSQMHSITTAIQHNSASAQQQSITALHHNSGPPQHHLEPINIPHYEIIYANFRMQFWTNFVLKNCQLKSHYNRESSIRYQRREKHILLIKYNLLTVMMHSQLRYLLYY